MGCSFVGSSVLGSDLAYSDGDEKAEVSTPRMMARNYGNVVLAVNVVCQGNDDVETYNVVAFHDTIGREFGVSDSSPRSWFGQVDVLYEPTSVVIRSHLISIYPDHVLTPN